MDKTLLFLECKIRLQLYMQELTTNAYIKLYSDFYYIHHQVFVYYLQSVPSPPAPQISLELFTVQLTGARKTHEKQYNIAVIQLAKSLLWLKVSLDTNTYFTINNKWHHTNSNRNYSPLLQLSLLQFHQPLSGKH